MNIWQEDDEGDAMELSDKRLAAELHAWCEKATGLYAETGAIMDGYGFVVNPVGSKPQVWHVDYTTDAAAIWIPLTQFTDRNATQFITLPADTPEDALEAVASNVDHVDVDALARQVDHLQVHQIVAKPMSVLYMGRGTIHRGITQQRRRQPHLLLHLRPLHPRLCGLSLCRGRAVGEGGGELQRLRHAGRHGHPPAAPSPAIPPAGRQASACPRMSPAGARRHRAAPPPSDRRPPRRRLGEAHRLAMHEAEEGQHRAGG